ncbi:MAG: DUF5687 family protein [Flavobacteriaceae bacterium]
MPTFSFRALNKKKLLRTPQWETKLAIRLLIGFFVLYMAASFLLVGVSLYFIVDETVPDQPPILTVNQFLVYYFFGELLLRYFLQQLPVTDIQSFLLLPIPKRRIIRNVLLKITLSLYNLGPFLIFLPFAIVLIVKGVAPQQALSWWFSVLALVLSINFLSFFIRKTAWIYPIVGGVLIGLFLEQYEIVPVISGAGQGLQWLYEHPLGVLAPLALLALMGRATARFLIKQCYLDTGLQSRRERVLGMRLHFLDRLGEDAPLIKNDLRLIFRNIRARQVVLMALLFLFYGLIFFVQDIYAESPMWVFAAIFTTGGFMLTYGQNVPAWDSEYYALLMCQNLSYRGYLKAKWLLMTLSIVVSAILCIPYLYFGLKVYALILAGALFNIGLGTFITLFSGTANRTPIKLNVKAKAFENTQAFNLTQFLFVIPKVLAPVGIFWLGTLGWGFYGGVALLCVFGTAGLLLRNTLLDQVVKRYIKGKYTTLNAFTKTPNV